MKEKNFKCPICGCGKHVKVDSVSDSSSKYSLFNLDALIEDSHLGYHVKLRSNFDAFVCAECGHVDLFAAELVSELLRK